MFDRLVWTVLEYGNGKYGDGKKEKGWRDWVRDT